jgi:hypothetical protein
MFWTIQWYFSSFWLTLSCCLNFGIISELISDYLYGTRKYKNRLSMFTEEKDQESSMKEEELFWKSPKQNVNPFIVIRDELVEGGTDSDNIDIKSDNNVHEDIIDHVRKGYCPLMRRSAGHVHQGSNLVH